MTPLLVDTATIARGDSDARRLRTELRLLLLKGWAQIAGLIAILGGLEAAVAICWGAILILGFAIARNRLLWCALTVVLIAICYSGYNAFEWLLAHFTWGHLPAANTDGAIAYAGLAASILGTLWGHGGLLDELVELRLSGKVSLGDQGTAL